MAKQKTYNPLKMWGSYVGAFVMVFLQIFTLSSTTVNTFIGQIIYKIKPLYWIGQFWERLILDNFFTTQSFNAYFYLAMFIIFLLTTVSGFLIGWGIHSLFRYTGGKFFSSQP